MFQWNRKQVRHQLATLEGKETPTIVLKNVTYLNSTLKQWLVANIWVCEDRIVYVGDELPASQQHTEMIDCTGQYAVSGYIEPHAHPFQLYNPLTLGHYASLRGTTTLVCDNLWLSVLFEKERAFSFIEELKKEVFSLYWWARYDSQTILQKEKEIFSQEEVSAWVNNRAVLQGGELTGWPQVLAGDDEMLQAMITTREQGKPIEGHLPAASANTLTKLALLGVTSDHEAMTGKDVYERLKLGYFVSLRYSSIRPDLPQILEELKAYDLKSYDNITLTTDGSTPAFHEQGFTDKMLEIAFEKGIPTEEAYNMVTINAARHLKIDDLHGKIAPGQLANINLLNAKTNPTPVSVLAKGQWVLKDKLQQEGVISNFSWEKFNIGKLNLDWNLTVDDFDCETNVGLEMQNSVIMKPYEVQSLTLAADENYVMLVDRHGKWRVNAVLKGFATNLAGFVSSYSNSGDIILIGNNKKRMIAAFDRLKEIGGGIVVTDEVGVAFEMPLSLAGSFSDQPLPDLSKRNAQLKECLSEKGYKFEDPVYSLLFLSSIHLPYVRITPSGVYDVMKKTILKPPHVR